MKRTAPWLGLALAIAVTTSMDANGLAQFSALVLIPLTLAGWWLQRLSRREIGLTWGPAREHLVAAGYAFLVLGAIALVGLVRGHIDVSDANWRTTGLNLALGTSVGILGVLLTEEGFFRGWLWGSLERAGYTAQQVLIITTIGFVVWHFSAIFLDTEFAPPKNQIPIYLVNATLLGWIWGRMRQLSRSALVPAVSHAVWNGLVYPLFGFGEDVGALGLADTSFYGPEVGWLGILLNGAFCWWLMRRRPAGAAA